MGPVGCVELADEPGDIARGHRPVLLVLTAHGSSRHGPSPSPVGVGLRVPGGDTGWRSRTDLTTIGVPGVESRETT